MTHYFKKNTSLVIDFKKQTKCSSHLLIPNSSHSLQIKGKNVNKNKTKQEHLINNNNKKKQCKASQNESSVFPQG